VVRRPEGVTILLRIGGFSSTLSAPLPFKRTLAPFGGRGIETATKGEVITCVVIFPGAGRCSLALTAMVNS
jgi:hypothetical protein